MKKINSQGFCSRCGRSANPCQCGQMLEFDHVEAIDTLDSPLGQSLFLMKRYGQARASYEFVRSGVRQIVARAETLVEEHQVKRLVVVPMSRQSYFANHDHPNEWILKGLQARAQNSKSPLHRFRDKIHFGIHAGVSRSALKRSDRLEKSAVCGSLSSPIVTMGEVKWRPEIDMTPNPLHHCDETPGALLVIDDVLTSGLSASKCATLADPHKSFSWLCLGVARSVRKRSH